MPQSVKSYIRTQEIGPVIGNILCNSLLAWLGNRKMESVTLFGDHSIVIDTIITSVIASLLVTLFASSGVYRDLKAGRIEIPVNIPRTKSILFRLPRNPWSLGLILGAGIAVVLVALTLAVFRLFNIPGITFREFLAFKVVYTGLLGFVVARWTILRQLAHSGSEKH